MPSLPTGTLTFLLTDIEGSTRLWQDNPETMGAAVERHVALIEGAVTAHGGVLVKSKGEGDSTFSVFTRPSGAVVAAVDAQRALTDESWPGGIVIRVRAAIHTGEAELREGDYYGTTVNRCARLRGVAHGGQTLISQSTADLIAEALPPGISVRSLGTHRLRDLERPEHIHQVGDEEFPPVLSLDFFRQNLPMQRTSLIGREDALIAVQKLLADNRLVTLTGVGGCGKTRLAVQLAADALDDFPDGVFFVELGPVSEPEIVAIVVARAVGMPGNTLGSGSGRSVRQDLLDFLSDRVALLVLDNCEHLVDVSAELCDDMLSRCRHLSILTTSREALEIAGEQAYSVPSLEVPTEVEVAEAASVQLFCDRAASVRQGFGLTPENESAVAEICRRLDGIPLALELAAVQVSHLSPHQIAGRLGDRFRLLTGGRRRVQRQQTLGATLDWSYELLDEPERILLRRLAVFPGAFMLQAVEGICADVGPSAVNVLRSLVGKSLVQTEEGHLGDLRYRLLETVRLYAEDKLLAAGEADSYRTRHRDYYLSSLEALPPKLGRFGRSPEVLPEQHNVRAALVWSANASEHDLVGRLTIEAAPMWGVSGGPGEGLRWLEIALENRSDLSPRVLTACLGLRSWLSNLVLDVDAMVGSGNEAVEIAAEGAEYYTTIAHAELCMFWSYQAELGDPAGPERTHFHGTQATEFAEKADTHEAMVIALVLYGMSLANLRDYERSAAMLGRAVEIGRGSTAIFNTAAASRLSIALFLLGRYDEALDAARLAAEVSEALGSWDPGWNVWVSTPLALALAANGAWEEARAHLEVLISEVIDSKIPGFLGETFVVMAAIAAMRSDWERSSRLLGVAFREVAYRSPSTTALYREIIEKVKTALDDDTRRQCRRDGLEMPIDEAIRYGLEGVSVSP